MKHLFFLFLISLYSITYSSVEKPKKTTTLYFQFQRATTKEIFTVAVQLPYNIYHKQKEYNISSFSNQALLDQHITQAKIIYNNDEISVEQLTNIWARAVTRASFMKSLKKQYASV